MPLVKTPLGMNARNFQYVSRYNTHEGVQLVNDKLATKKLFIEKHIATPTLFKTFKTRGDIRSYDFSALSEKGFVIKPATGYAGAGIVVIKTWDGEKGKTAGGEEYTVQMLKTHLIDILDGVYSMQNLPDVAFIEERIVPHSFFRKIGGIGVADIRVIVFHNIPVMAMLRLPTPLSKGKANITIGAIGFGIDLKTGITTSAVQSGKNIRRIPGTKTKVQGIKIPIWDDILRLASEAHAASGLGYSGVDIVIMNTEKPTILEMNARPGLGIQLANMDSLRLRLERVEFMKPVSPQRGVEIAKSLFAQAFAEKVLTEDVIIGLIEPVTIVRKGMSMSLEAKIDTGADRTSIDKRIAKKLELPMTDLVVPAKSAHGESERKTVKVTFYLGGRKITTVASISDRSKMKYKMLVGNRDMGGFLIRAVKEEKHG